jgi:signal transduction histidine kinase
MTKSLYVRVFLTFLGAIIVSLILSFLVTGRLFSDRINTLVQDDLITNGKTIIQSYEQSYPNDLDALMKGMTVFPLYAINIYSSAGKPMYVTANNYEQISISKDVMESVLNGGVYRSGVDNRHGKNQIVIGLPFQIEGMKYALFISPQANKYVSILGGYLQKQLLIVLLFGSVLILLAATYIVKPLQHLTRAARKMAKGDFRIKLRTGRKDEIGQLTESFNEMAKELGMLEQTRQQFVSNVSHEIQSPLTSIKGFTQALIHKKMDEESRIRLLTIIGEETDRLARLSQNLLQLSSLEYEHLQLEPSRFRLDEQLRNVVISYEPQWASKNLQLVLELEDIYIVADEDKLIQIWSNLLSNAIKFTDSDGCIHLEAIEKGHQVRVSIKDNGRGVPEDELSSIFKPFYKVDKSRSQIINGNGIGLSIVKRIVDLHQGDIQVFSRIGEGTTVTIMVPLELSNPKL